MFANVSKDQVKGTESSGIFLSPSETRKCFGHEDDVVAVPSNPKTTWLGKGERSYLDHLLKLDLDLKGSVNSGNGSTIPTVPV